MLNVELDHHSEFGVARRRSSELFERLARARCRRSCAAGSSSRSTSSWPCRASTTAGTRRRRWRRSSSPESPRADAAAALARFEGVGRRFELVGEAGGVAVYDDYAHNPAKVAAAIAAARERAEGRVLVLFQPHLFSRTRHVARELGRELAAADAVAVTDVYPAREQPVDGVSGKLVVDALADARPGFAPGWTPTLEDGARFVARRARPGDLVLTIGAGDVDRAARAAPRGALGEDRGGRQARAAHDGRHRRPGARLRAARDARRTRGGACAGRQSTTCRRGASGSGRTCSRRTRASTRSSLRLEGELAAVEVDGDLLVAGGGAPNAVCLHRARDAGLGGFEFACAIPGTAGGGVRMNAGAYGGDWQQVLVRALVVDAAGARWLTNDELDLSYRHSALRPGQVVARGRVPADAAPAEEIRATVAEMQAQRKATQPTNKRTFGSVFKNPEHELGAGRMIEAAA